ncbi:DNA-dependent protein kinase catalytic subunit-like [Oratosquilla oratoria]|uniref:DNA-dependent protein kinase catalytic subunit-like n=1 Tax=Oratosquilla oratoria TaxID=337810 RepID=UPI003F7603D9
MTPLEFDLCLSLLMGEKGILIIGRNLSKNQEFGDCKKAILDILKTLINKDAQRINKYAEEIRKFCSLLYYTDKSAKVRAAALDTLIDLLLSCHASIDVQQLGLSQFVERVFIDAKSNKTSTVLQQQLRILGVLCRCYPQEAAPHASLILKVLKEHLIKQTSAGSNPDLTALAGALQGICFYLHYFPEGMADEPQFYNQLYPHIHKVLNSELNLPRREAQRAALEIISKHGPKFSEHLYNNYESLFKWLLFWSSSHNRDDHKAGIIAMDTFVEVIANVLQLQAEGKVASGAKVFKYLVQQYNRLLEQGRSTSKMSIAVKGYGLLAGACHLYLSAEQVQTMFSQVLSASHHAFFQASEMIEDKLTSVPSFIESLAIIMNNMESISPAHLECVSQLVHGMIENFALVNFSRQFLVWRAIYTLLATLLNKPGYLHTFMHRLVYQTIIYSCSHDPLLETTEDYKNNNISNNNSFRDQKWRGLKNEAVTYRNFLPLWRGLLAPSSVQVTGLPQAKVVELGVRLYHVFIECILQISQKLNLETEKKGSDKDNNEVENEAAISDPVTGVTAKVPKDMQVYMNLVSLFTDNLPLQCEHQLSRHIPALCHHFIRLSSVQPLVAGHYSMIATTLANAKKTPFFKRTEDVQSATTIDLLTSFTKDILHRCRQYRDQLLAESLKLVLHLPVCIVKKLFPQLISPLQTALVMGMSYLPLAEVCISALQSWVHLLDEEILHEHLPNVLPLLLPYLRSQESGGEAEVQSRIISVKMSLAHQRRKVDMKKIKDSKKVNKTGMARVQLAILRFIGSLDAQLSLAVIPTDTDAVTAQAVRWDKRKHVVIRVPFADVKPEMYLDEFLPRVVDLATSSSDRQTKVASCELLHSIIIVMIGCGTHPNAKPMPGLYQHVFPALLRLSCDPDHVTRQLFFPLMFQSIHWFTKNRSFEHPHTAKLLEAIMDGLVNPSEPALRDISGQCLSEFVKWSRKQCLEKGKASENMKSILKRIFSLCKHPSAFNRLGGCLAWNSIYVQLREDVTVVDVWTIEVLQQLLTCLALAHMDDPALGTHDQAKQALAHVEKILAFRNDIFNKTSDSRRIPNGFSAATLEDVLKWLLQQCGRPQTEARRCSMEILGKLAPHTKGYRSSKEFVEKHCKSQEREWLCVVDILEGQNGNGISGFSPETWTEKEQTFELFFSFLENLLAALDGYSWIISENIAPAEDTLGSQESKLFMCIEFFLEKIMTLSVPAFLGAGNRGESISYTPGEEEDFVKLKCSVFVRLLDVVTLLMDNGSAHLVKESTNATLWKMVALAVLDPMVLDFNLKDTEVIQQLPLRLKETLIIAIKKLPADVQNLFIKILEEQLALPRYNIQQLLPTSFTGDIFVDVQTKHIFQGMEILLQSGWLAKSKVLEQMVNENLVVWSCESIVSHDKKSAIALQPAQRDFVYCVLQLGLHLGDKIVPYVLEQVTSKETLVGPLDEDVNRGSHLLSQLELVLMPFLLANVEKCVLWSVEAVQGNNFIHGLSFLAMLLQAMVSKAELRKRYGEKAVRELQNHWSSFAWQSGEGHQEALLNILSLMFLVDSKRHLQTTCQASSPDVIFYCSVLSNRSLEFRCKVQALKLLPFYCTMAEDVIDKTMKALSTYAENNFPLKSDEFPKGSSRDHEYHSALAEVMTALHLTGSHHLLQFLIEIICREEEHRYEQDFQDTLGKYIQNMTRPKKDEALNSIFTFFKDSDKMLQKTRLSTVERVLVPMLQNVNSLSVTKFFERWICTIMSGVSLNITGRDAEQHKDLVTKTASFLLIQILYYKLSKEQVFSSDSTVNAAFRPQDKTGKEMTKEVFKQASKVAKGELRHDQTQADLRRKCACAAYNAMVSVLSCVQNELKFYTAFLFTENTVKGEAMWESLIDCNKAHSFDIEVNNNMSKKKKFVAVRKSLKEERKKLGLQYSSTVEYFSSHYLSDSSLREDLSHYDFSSSVVLTMTPKNDQERLDPEDIVGSFTSSNLDQNDYNDHDVMPNLTAIIHYMKNSGILPEWKSESMPSYADVPAFMKHIKSKLEEKAPCNVKLFLLRLITNTASVFAPYGQHFVAPILSCMTDSTLGDNINYFFSDILIMLLEWGPQAIPENPILASRVLKRLFINAPHTRMDVFKYNLEITRTVIESWKSVVEVPYEVIYSLMEVREGKSREVEAGLQLLGAVLHNGLSSYPLESAIHQKRCEGAILRLLGERYVSLYGPAAEVAGLILKLEVNKQGDEAVSGGFADQVVQKLLDQTRQHHNQAITSIYNIHKHCPAMVKRFINKLLLLLPTLYGSYQADVLRCLVSYASSLEDVYAHLKEQNLLEVLRRKEPSTQLVSLELVDAVMLRLAPKHLMEFLPGIVDFVGHPTPKCRELMYQILFKVYDKYSCETEGESLHIAQESRTTLLRGTTDKDAALRQTVLNYWTNRTPGTLPERLLYILKEMYSADIEDSFLQLATYILMEATQSSPDYTLPMFTKPLTDCKFREFKVSGSWQARHASMMPLFVETQQAESSGSTSLTSLISMTQGEDMDVEDGGGRRYVEATQANMFPATQQQAGGAYNWVTGSTFDTTIADMEFEATHTGGQSTSGLFSFGSKGGDGGSKRSPAGLGKSKLRPVDQPDGADKSENAVKSKLLRRRFTRNQDREKEHIYFAKREEQRRKLRDKLEEERKLRREAQVTMHRKYRIGELPDIEIPHQALIAPLQVLAQHDTTIAKLLMTKVYQGLVDNVDSLLGRSQVQEWKEHLADSIRSIFSSSYQYHPQLIGALLHIAMENNIYIDPENICEACIASQTEPLGILALEQQLLQDEEHSTNVRKKPRLDSSSVLPRPTLAWINMAELYKSVGMWDAVTGIVNQMVGQHQETKKALQYEIINQHRAAFDLYREALRTIDWEDPPSSAEERVWVESYCTCAETLGQWTELEKYIEDQFLMDESTGSKNLDAVWDLPRPAPILTSLIHSKLMNILEGSPSDGGLCSFVDSSMQSSRKATLLESNFGAQLAVLALYQEKSEWAKTLQDKAVQTCLSSLGQYTCLTPKPLVASIRSVQLLMELQDYLYMNKQSGTKQCRGILQQWKKHQPHKEDPSLLVQCIASYRTLYLDLLTKELKDEDEQLLELIDKVQLQTLMNVVHNALGHGNFLMAGRYLKRIHRKVQHDCENSAKFYFLMTRYNIVKNRQTPGSGIKYLVEAWAKCLGNVSDMKVVNEPHVEMEYLQLESMICKEICHVLKQVPITEIEGKHLDTLHSRFKDVQKEDSNSWMESLLACSLSYLIQAVNLEKSKQEAAASSIAHEKHYKNQVALANFCEEVLADNSWKENIDVLKYQQHLISSILSAMAQGSQEAHHRFPRLLNLLDDNQGLTETFMAEAARIPVWMFVLWISHILIYFDKNPGPAVHSIVIELAKVYPQALVYPFNISQQQFNFATANGKLTRAVCEKVRNILAQNHLVHDFAAAMFLVSVPFVAVKQYCVGLRDLKDKKELVERVKHLEEEYVKVGISNGSLMEKGSAYQKAGIVFKKSLNKHFGEGLKKIGSMSVNEIKKKLKDWLQELENSSDLKKNPGNLKELSPWLANFQSANFDDEMEIPGQYSGYTKPLPEYHVRLTGFGESVRVMHSLRKPMQLVLRGDDEKEHRFLAKWGEDLRTDQRFEQIFSMMNDLFRSSVLCSQGSSVSPKLETFKVIPLSLKVGLLEWVESTIPLRELILSTEESKKKYNEALRIYSKAENWEPKHRTKVKVVSVYERCVSEMEWDALKKSLLAIASGSEGFFYLRSGFLSSYATLCASHWMLGIGDRHLSNCLVSSKTGRAIGIDFGHHFESATQFLRVPELIPFRLTPQIVNIMKPLGIAGILRETMVRVIGTIRESHFALFAAVEAFVKEPTKDWLEWVKREAGETTDKNIELFSQKRLEMLQDKLQGANAWYITKQALSLSHHGTLKFLQEALAGEGENLRSELKKTQLTVHEQVDALIDLAMDPNILGRTYIGWDPFV